MSRFAFVLLSAFPAPCPDLRLATLPSRSLRTRPRCRRDSSNHPYRIRTSACPLSQLLPLRNLNPSSRPQASHSNSLPLVPCLRSRTRTGSPPLSPGVSRHRLSARRSPTSCQNYPKSARRNPFLRSVRSKTSRSQLRPSPDPLANGDRARARAVSPGARLIPRLRRASEPRRVNQATRTRPRPSLRLDTSRRELESTSSRARRSK